MNNLLVLYQSSNDSNEFSYYNWKIYCKKQNIKFLHFTHIVNSALDRSNQIFYIYKILEENNMFFDNIAFASDNTMINSLTPNVFDIVSDNKLTFAEWDGDFAYLLTNIETYNKIYFKIDNLDFTKFFDFGFFIVNKSHRHIFDNIIKFLEQNYSSIVGKLDTTFIPQNFFFNVEYNKLPYTYNMIDMYRKEIQMDENIKKLGNIFNFRGISDNRTIMKNLINFI